METFCGKARAKLAIFIKNLTGAEERASLN